MRTLARTVLRMRCSVLDETRREAAVGREGNSFWMCGRKIDVNHRLKQIFVLRGCQKVRTPFLPHKARVDRGRDGETAKRSSWCAFKLNLNCQSTVLQILISRSSPAVAAHGANGAN